MKKECVTMLLAGGAGTRLGMLTKNLAKPAVPFGGRYRIIDFALSNCLNSGMNTVGVVTQYSPLVLHRHIGVGKAWGLDRLEDGLTILSPFTTCDGGCWYLGTADAIFKNCHFIDQYHPDYVLILSGDHIYQMDYNQILAQHKETEADVTIATMEVPWEETSRFGILNTTKNLRIYEFEEKPSQAKNNLASMGIYVFNWEVLKLFLEKDATKDHSDHDFGKDIIPAMLADELHLYAYVFEGYWKDVGTIQSYWEAHMDLLNPNSTTLLEHGKWKNYSRDSYLAPQLIGENAVIRHSLISNGCIVDGTVEESVLFEKVQIHQHAIIHQSILHPNAQIGEHVLLDRVIVQENVTIPDHTKIAANEEEEPIVVSNENINSILLMR
ncbi:glucose-1-phosphate adenylyltransferase [Gracilibacillus dipsosauri]|uniref:glucose-1-phosphate adenylyltransferase n=1 Tax=Gracilibacillus dipsosauri TaxID=178340 RepID=UPI0024098681